LRLIPVYATTERLIKKEVSSKKGEVALSRIFRHKIFRVYGR